MFGFGDSLRIHSFSQSVSQFNHVLGGKGGVVVNSRPYITAVKDRVCR